MIFYLQRHGLATHLVEDYDKKVTREIFIQTTKEWKNAKLTNLGKNQVVDKQSQLEEKVDLIVYSPLFRAKQTAELMNTEGVRMQANSMLEEILSAPPRFFFGLRLKIRVWIMICVLDSLLTFKIFKYLKEARTIFNTYRDHDKNILFVSHQARIITMLIYCFFSKDMSVKKIDTKPSGISIIRLRRSE